MTLRVVFDTNVILSALLFQAGQLAWLRGHWAGRTVRVLASSEVIAELIGTLAYPKFQLSPDEIQELLGDYLPYVDVVGKVPSSKGPRCRDPDDEKIIDLAMAGGADVLVTGDRDLLAMRGKVSFVIETPAEYGKRFGRGS